MYVMTVIYYASGVQDFIYGADRKEAAEADFKKLESAIAEYQKFKNDTSESVTLSDHLGSSVFRVEHLVSVSLNNITAQEPEQLKLEAYRGQLLAVREAAKAGVLSPHDSASTQEGK